MSEVIYSTGIDIGTTTTHLIVIKLSVSVKEGFGCAPKVEIDKKEIIYMSKIYFTPLEDDGIISAKGVKKIIDSEYKKADISPKILKSGAVIITGESARKRNAKNLLFEISKYAGDFIVAEAGGESESILAGKGIGAQSISQNEFSRVCSIDIGGGTTNIAVFDSGEVKAASCIDVGGRLIKVKKENNKAVIDDISESILPLLEKNNLKIKKGDILTSELREKTVNALWVRILEEISNLPKADRYIFSGGVGECIDNNYSDYEFNDLGVLLARKIEKSNFFKNCNCEKAKNSIRATVIGAGNYSFEISGSTISHFGCKLPIRNIPCVKINVKSSNDIENCTDNLRSKISKFDLSKTVAISFDGYSSITFDEMMKLSKNIAKQCIDLIEHNQPIIVLIDKDIGKAVGICLKKALPNDYPLLAIDCVSADDGDYLDIGESVGGGKAVPVAIKKLVFSV